MKKLKNKNITPIENIGELDNEMNYIDFIYKEYFIHLCNLIPDKNKEKLNIEYIDQDKKNVEGLVYVFIINDKIFKIGHTIKNITDRIRSYNCGKTEYRINGTNSTTNYFILQSLLKIGLLVQVYAFFPEKPKYKIFGTDVSSSLPPAKKAEKIILESLTKKPLGCTTT